MRELELTSKEKMMIISSLCESAELTTQSKHISKKERAKGIHTVVDLTIKIFESIKISTKEEEDLLDILKNEVDTMSRVVRTWLAKGK